MIESEEKYLSLYSSNKLSDNQRVISEPISECVLLSLIENRPDIRPDIVKNKFLPDGVIRVLAFDDDDHVRLFVAMKRKLPKDLFVTMAKDADEGVRRRVLYNSQVTVEALDILCVDEVEDIAFEAQQKKATRKTEPE